MKRSFVMCLIVMVLAGCATWIRTGGPFSAPAQNVSADLPDGWMRMNTDEFLIITRDGVLLQNILVEKIHVEDSLQNTKKKFRQGMLPQELAEVIIDNASSNQKMLDLKVETNKPAMVGGQSGFKLVYTYKDENGLKYKTLYYGFMPDEFFYGIHYDAPQRHYYNRDLEAFEKVVASLKPLN